MQTTSPETLERATALLARLVAFPSVSSAANLPLIEWAAEELRRSGVEAQILPSPDQEGKANLIATLGPQKEGGVVLSGHTDVVPVSDQAWESDPFVPHRKGRQTLRQRHLRHERLSSKRACRRVKS